VSALIVALHSLASRVMVDFSRAGLESIGFWGFVRFDELDDADVPKAGGVYAVLREVVTAPVFLDSNPGGRFKQRDPTVDAAHLAERWVASCSVTYIGKATNLRKRLRQYRDFGRGRPVGHWGGRFVWQIEDASEHVVCWKCTDQAPREVEIELLTLFRERHGRLPFANINS
jgi:hypothetical protein